MRLEVIVPDDSVEAGILSGLEHPERYVLDLVRADGGRGAAVLAEEPDYLAIMRQAESSPNRHER